MPTLILVHRRPACRLLGQGEMEHEGNTENIYVEQQRFVFATSIPCTTASLLASAEPTATIETDLDEERTDGRG